MSTANFITDRLDYDGYSQISVIVRGRMAYRVTCYDVDETNDGEIMQPTAIIDILVPQPSYILGTTARQMATEYSALADIAEQLQAEKRNAFALAHLRTYGRSLAMYQLPQHLQPPPLDSEALAMLDRFAETLQPGHCGVIATQAMYTAPAWVALPAWQALYDAGLIEPASSDAFRLTAHGALIALMRQLGAP